MDLDPQLSFAFAFFFSFLFLFFFLHAFQRGQNSLITYCLTLFTRCSGIVHALFMGSTITLFKKNIKNGSHNTIHTFKNYFATIFLISIPIKISCIQTYSKFVLKSHILCYALPWPYILPHILHWIYDLLQFWLSFSPRWTLNRISHSYCFHGFSGHLICIS